MWRLSRGCEEAVVRVWGDCLEGVGMLYGVCGEVVWKVWEAVMCRKTVVKIY